MASFPIKTILEQSHITPQPAILGDKSLSLTYFDFQWLKQPPVHYLFFYELSITESQFINTVVTDLKHSLSITLPYFYPFIGKLIIFPNHKQKPEIRYVEGDSVALTFEKCNLDFNEVTGNHPRHCEMFYHLIPLLGQSLKTSDYIQVPVFSVQVTLFPNHGISIGMTFHHSLGDARTHFYFMKAWTSIAQSGSDKLFLENGTLPLYDRMIKDPKLDESYLKCIKVETFNKEYQPPSLSGPTDKVRATFILTRTMLDGLKKIVSTQLPTLAYVSSFTVACGYMWSCIASLCEKDEPQAFAILIDWRARMHPPLPATYFGNCIWGCLVMEKTSLLRGNEGFITASKSLGECLDKTLTDTCGIVKDIESHARLMSEGMSGTFISVTGTPRLRFYDMDFGWGKPKKFETISTDYGTFMSMNACKESNQDIEIGISLSPTEMEALVLAFDDGLKNLI